MASPLVPRPAGRGVHGHLGSWLVVDKVGESVGRVGGPAWCSLPHVRVVVKVPRYVNHVLDDGSRVSLSVEAVGAAVPAVVDLVRVGCSVARDHLAKEAIVVERLGAVAVLCVPVENDVAPAEIGDVHAQRYELADSPYCDSVAVHACDGHIERPPDEFVEGAGFE